MHLPRDLWDTCPPVNNSVYTGKCNKWIGEKRQRNWQKKGVLHVVQKKRPNPQDHRDPPKKKFKESKAADDVTVVDDKIASSFIGE